MAQIIEFKVKGDVDDYVVDMPALEASDSYKDDETSNFKLTGTGLFSNYSQISIRMGDLSHDLYVTFYNKGRVVGKVGPIPCRAASYTVG